MNKCEFTTRNTALQRVTNAYDLLPLTLGSDNVDHCRVVLATFFDMTRHPFDILVSRQEFLFLAHITRHSLRSLLIKQISNFQTILCNKTKTPQLFFWCDYGYSLSSNHISSQRAFGFCYCRLCIFWRLLHAHENCLLFSRLSFQWYLGVYKRFLFTDSCISSILRCHSWTLSLVPY